MIKNQVFFSQLDGLRFFAVLLTLVAHWFPRVGWPLLPYSWNGVDVFFVISGFLITLLLLRKKDEQRDSNIQIIRKFLVRRILRLFPLYYLYILFFFLAFYIFHILFWRQGMGWYLISYTTNIYYQSGAKQDGIFEHTWSLAVEEQFYLIWPWIIIYLSPKKIEITTILFIVIGLSTYIFPLVLEKILFPPVKNFNTLGAGALLAYVCYYKYDTVLFKIIFRYRLLLLLFFLSFYLFIILSPLSFIYNTLIRESILSLGGFFLILNAAAGWGGVFGKFMESKPIAYLGKISYGIYLIHFPIPSICNLVSLKLLWQFKPAPMLSLTIYLAITLCLASISYKFIETPFLRLKKDFA